MPDNKTVDTEHPTTVGPKKKVLVVLLIIVLLLPILLAVVWSLLKNG